MDIMFGTVVEDPAPLPNDGSDGARYVEVDLQPDEGLVFARVANIGCGEGRGIFADPKRGDEVLVLVPGIDRQGAVVLGAFNNTRSPNPSLNNSDRLLLLHNTEVRLQVGQTSEAEPVVLESLLRDLKSYVEIIDQFMTTASTAVTGPQVAAAAAVALTAIEIGQFATRLGTDYRAPSVKAGG